MILAQARTKTINKSFISKRLHGC